MKTVTFNELRRIKDRLPDGSIRQIAAELELSEDTVRNYFGGLNHSTGNKCGIHIEPGPDGGIVVLDDSTILDKALIILGESNYRVTSVAVNV
jgi:transcriptional antiterminator